MPKKTTIFIAILTVITVGLIYLALTTQDQQVTQPESESPQAQEEQVVEKTAVLSFLPETVTLSPQAPTTTLDIVLDSGIHVVSGVQVELLYDPQAISNVEVTSSNPSLLGTINQDFIVLFSNVDQLQGRVSYAAGITPSSDKVVTGDGSILTLTITKNPSFEGTETPIAFLDKSAVTEEGITESVLNTSTPLIVQFSNETTAPVVTQAPVQTIPTTPPSVEQQ